MADQPILFGSTDVNPTAGTVPADSSLVPVLVGEGRKYKTVEDLAKAHMHADEFIETLKSENADFREKLKGATTMDQVLERLSKKEDLPTTPATSTPDIAKLVRETVTGLETEKVRASNLHRSDAMLKEIFGDKAQEVFESQASTPELKAALTSLASVDPVKFVSLFKKEPAPAGGFHAAASGGHNVAAFNSAPVSTENDPGTQAFYTKLMKTDKNKYYSSEVQLAMHNAAQANPTKFFGRKI